MNLTPTERHRQKMRAKAAARIAAAHPPDPIGALLAMSSGCAEPPDSCDRAAYLTPDGEPRPEAVQIGWHLWRSGGTGAMRAALRAVPAHDRAELSAAWDGIGNDFAAWLD